MPLRLIDSHNHFQDPRLDAVRDSALAGLAQLGLTHAVVNGTREDDWQKVRGLTQSNTSLIPSYGLHPWYMKERSPRWRENFAACFNGPNAAVGEIGLDRWMEGFDLPQQEEVFLHQWRFAAERNLPATIHCLRAWGRLLELLESNPAPACGFLLHSYGGPAEMIGSFTKLGARFSISGHFAQERKAAQAAVFKQVPRDRLLIETDAPDMPLPASLDRHPSTDPATGKLINHPENILAVYEFTAKLLDEPIDRLAERISANFMRLFGSRLA